MIAAGRCGWAISIVRNKPAGGNENRFPIGLQFRDSGGACQAGDCSSSNAARRPDSIEP